MASECNRKAYYTQETIIFGPANFSRMFILTLIGSELPLPINGCSPEASIARATSTDQQTFFVSFCLLPPTCPPHLRLSIHIPTPTTSNTKQFNFPCTHNTCHNLSSWNDQRPVLGRLIASVETTRGYIGCFVSDILSIDRFGQSRHANFHCFDRLGTARVCAYSPNCPTPRGSTTQTATMSTPPGPGQGQGQPRVLRFILDKRVQRGTGP